MSISIDFGNFWDALSGIGTVAAVIFSLWIVRRDSKVNIKLMIGSRLKIDEGNGLILGSDLDKIIHVQAYNAGTSTVGVSFIGFALGIKKKSFFESMITKNKKELTHRVGYLDNIMDSPKLELLGPGQATVHHEIEWKYLYGLGEKYIKEDGTLTAFAEFEDFTGKQYIQQIVLVKPLT